MKFIVALVLLLAVTSCHANVKPEGYNGELTFVIDGKSKTIKNLPRFEDYPAESASHKIADDIDWASRNHSWQFRTRLRKGLKNGPNFNGHYAVITHGCGVSCQVNWIIDTTTGKIIDVISLTEFGVSYRLGSSLIVSQLPGDPADLHGDYGSLGEVVFYKIEGGKLKLIQTVKPFSLFHPELGVACEPACAVEDTQTPNLTSSSLPTR